MTKMRKQMALDFSAVTSDVCQAVLVIRVIQESLNGTRNQFLQLNKHAFSETFVDAFSKTVGIVQMDLNSFKERIKGCAADIETTGTVSIKNRVLWVWFRYKELPTLFETAEAHLKILKSTRKMFDSTLPHAPEPPMGLIEDLSRGSSLEDTTPKTAGSHYTMAEPTAPSQEAETLGFNVHSAVIYDTDPMEMSTRSHSIRSSLRYTSDPCATSVDSFPKYVAHLRGEMGYP